MTGHLKLRIHVSEPWDFERTAGTAELTGWTVDHVDPDNEEWEVHLDEGFDYHERRIARLLAGPRYVGEHMSRMFDAVAGFPVRLAYAQAGGWHYAFIGMISERHAQGDDTDNGAIG
jgi:hypothetical protein